MVERASATSVVWCHSSYLFLRIYLEDVHQLLELHDRTPLKEGYRLALAERVVLLARVVLDVTTR